MRKFVILEEQPDYYKKVQGLTPKGHMNIEIRDGRGKLILNVDNLKISSDEEKLYKACLVGTDNKDFVNVDLGVIVLNDRGKGNLEWKFDPSSVGGTSLSIEKFNNILVKEVDITDKNENIVVPLSGYIYKKDGSLVKLMKKQVEKELHKKQKIENQIVEKTQLKKPEEDNKEILEEVEIKEKPQQIEEKQDHILEDTYVAIEGEVKIEEIEEIEEARLEEQETRIENVQEESHEEFQEESQEVIQEEVNQEQVQEKEVEERESKTYKIVAEEIEANELEVEELGVDNLSLEDIIPVNIELGEFEDHSIDIEQEEQINNARTIWSELETGEETQDDEGDLLEKSFLDANIIHEDNDGFIKMGEDFKGFFVDEEITNNIDIAHNQQVIYNYGDYVDNTYGNKIDKMDAYMETAKNYSKQVANYTMDILKFFDKVEPFKENLRDCEWWKIEQSKEDIHRGFLPFYNYMANVYYPYPLTSKTTTCQNVIEKYGHYIFGTVKKQEEIKYYVYGVPGKFTIAEHPYNGATGFNTWLQDKNLSEEGLGYWLIYIDALSGKIVNPVNPTIPTR